MSQEPSNPAGYLLGARVAEAQGRFADGFVMMKRAWELAGDGGVNLRVLVIRVQALSGERRRPRCQDELERAARRRRRLHPRDRALVALGFGETARGAERFDLAFAERDPALVWMPVDPRVDALRERPRFRAMLQKLSLN